MNARFALSAVILVLLIPISAQGQAITSTGRKFNPPVTTIEITGNEAKAKTYLLHFGGGGGGCCSPPQVEFHTKTSKPYWVLTPVFVSPSVALNTLDFESTDDPIACNYRSDQAPHATLTTPDGQEQELQVFQSEIPGETDCWRVDIPIKVGMVFGLYTLTLDQPQGRISHQWGFDYLPCVNVTSEIRFKGNSITNRRVLISGLAPHQTLNLHLFHVQHDFDARKPSVVSQINSRQIPVADTGDAVIDIHVASDAGFDLSNVWDVLVGPHGEFYNDPGRILDKDANGWIQFSKDFGLVSNVSAIPKPKYPIYAIDNITGINSTCTQRLGSYAQSVPADGVSVPLYKNYNDLSAQIGSVPIGDPVLVKEQKAGIANGRVVVWSRVRTEQGLEGWSYGNQLQNIFIPSLTPGLKMEIQKVGLANGQVLNVVLTNAPNINARTITTLRPGDQVTLIQAIDAESWLYVKTSKGQIGYIPATISHYHGRVFKYGDPYEVTAARLPWAPADVSQIPTPIAPESH